MVSVPSVGVIKHCTVAIYYSESFECRCYSTVHCGDVLLGVLSVGVTKYCTDSGHVLFGEFQVSGL